MPVEAACGNAADCAANDALRAPALAACSTIFSGRASVECVEYCAARQLIPPQQCAYSLHEAAIDLQHQAEIGRYQIISVGLALGLVAASLAALFLLGRVRSVTHPKN
jgi:hypothetical protein